MTLNFEADLDWAVVAEIEKFWQAVNDRTLWSMGVLPSYTPPSEALGPDVEYFHFSICADARMRYLGENIILVDDAILSPRNKLCNAVIAHLYGGRRIYTLFSGITDPKTAFIDFERMLIDPQYVQEIYANADYARSHGYKFYGTTELHTSLQTSGRNFCRVKYGDPARLARNTDILEWVASWITSGLIDKLLYRTNTLEEAFNHICGLPGVGAYYGYHLGVDCSLLPTSKFNHDQQFCVPGAGCCLTIDRLFPNLTKQKKFPYGEAVCFVEREQRKLFPNLTFHPALWNIQLGEKKLFDFEQDKLMVYGCEVGLCQFAVYERLAAHPHLIEKRKVGVDPDLTPLVLREQGNPVEPIKKASKREAAPVKQSNLLGFE